jgi:hypothetical protein
MTDVIIKNAQNFRYLLYQFKDKKTDIAEIEFWSSEKGKMIKLHGKPIGNNGPYGYSIDKAMDGDWLSYFSRDTNESQYSYIGLDLGKNHKKFISKIRFCPRNDKNNITPDDVYELFYWDKRWISLGIQTATDSGQITFKNAPTNALFWLHDITEGKEERIFTYMDGKQYFW